MAYKSFLFWGINAYTKLVFCIVWHANKSATTVKTPTCTHRFCGPMDLFAEGGSKGAQGEVAAVVRASVRRRCLATRYCFVR